MCLAIPGRITEIHKKLDDTFRMAKVDFDGVVREVSLAMLPEAGEGDYVLVHVGVALQIVDEKEAEETMKYLKQIGELDE
jgi:hydrogenase expression/formation protein HypC